MKKRFLLALFVMLGLTLVSCTHEHSYSEEWSKDATSHWHQAVCEHDTEVSDKADHTWDQGNVTTEATCEAKGVKTYTCTVCSQTKTEEIAALGHSWNDGEVTTEPTETTEGVKTYTCSVCGGTKTESIAVLEHTHKFASEWTYDETHHWHVATCEHTNEVSEKAEHEFDWSQLSKATCLDAEVLKGVCACGYETTKEGEAALGHTDEVDAAVDPTCTETGLTEGKHCSVCDAVLVAQEEVEALGHALENVFAVAATDSTDGNVAHRHCSRCEKNFEYSSIVNLSALANYQWANSGTVYSASASGKEYTIANGWRTYIIVDPEGRIAFMIQNPPSGFGDLKADMSGSYARHSHYATTNPVFANISEEAVDSWGNYGYDLIIPEGGYYLISVSDSEALLTAILGSYTENAVNTTTFNVDDIRLYIDPYDCLHIVDSSEELVEIEDVVIHNWNDGEVTLNPTKDSDGEMTYTCSVCGSTKTEVIEYVPVEEIVLSTNRTLIFVDEEINLVTTFNPTDATDKTLVWSSSDEGIATVDPSTGLVKGIALGQATITATSVDGVEGTYVINVSDEVIDGVVGEKYGSNYMSYTTYGTTSSTGVAEIDMYWYETEFGLFLAFDVVGTMANEAYTDAGGKNRTATAGIVFLAMNSTTKDGYYHKYYANGGIRRNTLASLTANNNNYTGWTNTTVDKIDYMRATSVVDGNYVDSCIIETVIYYSDYGVTSADELSLALGWVDLLGGEIVYNRVNPVQNNTFSGNNATDWGVKLFSKTEAGKSLSMNEVQTEVYDDYWWTFAQIEAAKTVRNIRLDGHVDEAYQNHFTFTATNPDNSSDVSTYTIYWYEEDDCMYLAFNVNTTGVRTLNNTGSAMQASAGINFTILNTTTNTGKFYRSYGSLSNFKDIAISTANLYSCKNAKTNFIRGSKGSIYNTIRTGITEYTIEVRIDYATYGATSADELSIAFGAMIPHATNQKMGYEELCSKSDTTYKLASTADATGMSYLRDVTTDYHWTLADFEARMEAQKQATE